MDNKRRGGRRPGAGRRPSIATFRRDEYLIVTRGFRPPELARVVRASTEGMEIQLGDEVVTLRRPTPGEIAIRAS